MRLRSGSAAPQGRKKEYLKYLKSDLWKEKRALALKRDGHCCTVKNCPVMYGLEVHHRRYPKHPMKLGEEPIDWLVTLCFEHHRRIHRKEPQEVFVVVLPEATREAMGIEQQAWKKKHRRKRGKGQQLPAGMRKVRWKKPRTKGLG